MMPQTMNRFAYANGNPHRYTDPSGHDGVIADGLHKVSNSSALDTGNETFDGWARMGRNFVAGFGYDTVNLLTFGTFGQADRNLQKAIRGEQITVGDMLSTNWYGGNQDGWNPGNALKSSALAFGGGAVDFVKGLGSLAYHTSVPMLGCYAYRNAADPLGEAEKRKQAVNSALAGVKQWWGDLSGFVGLYAENPDGAMNLLGNAADAVGPEKTFGILGRAEFDAAMIADGGIGAVKGAKSAGSFVRNLARGESELAQTARFSGARQLDWFADDSLAESRYAAIREMSDDVSTISKNTGIPEQVISSVKQHTFMDFHDVAIRQGITRNMRFTADPEIAHYWLKAVDGNLSKAESLQFENLMAHEYVESALMKHQGLPYNSTNGKAWIRDSGTTYEGVSGAYGAHDVAPIIANPQNPYKHWEKLFGIKIKSDK